MNTEQTSKNIFMYIKYFMNFSGYVHLLGSNDS